MPGSFFSRAAALLRPRLFICQVVALLLASTMCFASQQTAAQKAGNPASRPAAEKSAPTPDASASAASQTLAQFNDALENLAAKVSPAVVQILVTGSARSRNKTAPRPLSSSASTPLAPASSSTPMVTS